MALLEVTNLGIAFGGLQAVAQLDMKMEKGQLYGLIGPNGAGKTTFFNCVTGIYKPTEGTVHLYGANGEKHLLNGRKPHLITALGMARTFQNIRLFSDMTVLENVMIGRHCRTKAGIWGALTRNPATRREEQESIDISYSLLETVHLQDLWNEKACNLAYGAQRRLEIVRALATNPSLLLLDEPANHLDLVYQQNLFTLIGQWLQTPGRAALSVVHDLSIARRYGTHAVLMNEGRAVAQGPIEAVFTPENLQKVYSMDVYGWMNDLYALWQEPVETLRRPG